MNKNRLFKLLNELKTSVNNTNDRQLLIYITWINGDIEFLRLKAEGKTAFIYPYGATYKDLYEDLTNHIYCKNICEELKDRALYHLVNDTNIKLLEDILKTLRIDY